MTDDLNEKLDYVRDRVVADAKAKPTPEEIMQESLYKNAPAPDRNFPKNIYHYEHWGPLVEKQIQALTVAGLMIVNTNDLERLLSEGLSDGGKAFVSKRLRAMVQRVPANESGSCV